MNTWIPKPSALSASALLSSVFFWLATSAAAVDWSSSDSSNLESASDDLASILSFLNNQASYGLLWELEAQRSLLNTINAALTSNNGSSLLSKVDDILTQLQPAWTTGFNTLSGLLNDWKLDQSSDLSAILAAIQAQGVTNTIEVSPNVSVTNICECPPYDDVWLKRFLTGREDGENIYTPKFRYTGAQTSLGGDASQNLQEFLSYTLGSFRDNTRNYNMTWEQAFNASSRKIAATDTTMGINYQYFTFWLAEGMRRLIETNQLVAANVDLNRRSVTENLSLILMELREIASNSVAQVTPEYPTEISVTNQVAIEASEYPVIDDPALPEMIGEVTPEEYAPPDSDPLDETGLDLDTSGGNRVLILWDNFNFAAGGTSIAVPSGTIDFGTTEFRTPVRVFGSICRTCWWLIYYLALARLLRREYVYYTSLGHTEGAA